MNQELSPGTTSEGTVALAYGLRDERIVHIREVPSGLACDCVCPHCRVRLVARRGEIKAPHFAHYHSEECKHARETALHILAKEILEAELNLSLPEWCVTNGFRKKILQPGVSYAFDGAALEQRVGEVVPDVIVKKAERELLVEIFVTHACDNAKVAKIRALELSAIEIDLSALPHDAGREIVREQVLAQAPRRWLTNPRLSEREDVLLADWEAEAKQEAAKREREWINFQAQMARKEKARLARSRQQALAIISAVKHKQFVERAVPRLPTRAMARVEQAGYSQYIGLPLKDEFAFVVCSKRWQAMAFDRFVLSRGTRYFPTKWAFDSIREAAFIESSCRGFIDDEVEELVQEELPDFRKPYGILWDYLKHLSVHGLLVHSGKWWRPSLPVSHEQRLA